MVLLLLERKALSLKNTVASWRGYELWRNLVFAAAGVGLLYALYCGFYRLAAYLMTVQLIGGLLLWKLTALLLLATFTMTSVSGLLTALTTLFYSFDLKFLVNAPIPARAVFLEKSLESAFFASWMVGVILVPYMSALARVNGYGWPFVAGFAALVVPFLMLAASVGVALTLILLRVFPSSRTRDVIWVLSSLSMTLVYGLVRFSKPERLIRPDALKVVAEYLRYLQAPTAPFLPSWWLTRGLQALAARHWLAAAREGLLLYGAAFCVYGALAWLAGRIYFEGYSGAQEGAPSRRVLVVEPLPERRWLGRDCAALFWRERTAFFRDVKHWSQILLIGGLIFVYLFSIARLPLDSPDLRSLASFLNVGTAGFVLAALGLRFTFPSISLEGRAWWVVRSSPVGVESLMRQKALFSALPMSVMALVLGASANRLLHADAFTAWVSLGALLVVAWALCAMGVGFGALFPMFEVENIHQIESSLGGFVYMASSLVYIGATIMALSWPMRMHFEERFGRAGAWRWPAVAGCAAFWLLLNAAAFIMPWTLGRRALEAFES